MTHIRTSRGWLSLASPAPEQIDIRDIAKRLARINRFCGDTEPGPYSVAQHSVHVSEDLGTTGATPRQQLAGLLHDGHEAYIGDVIRPVDEHLFGDWPVVEADPLTDLKWGLDKAIWAAFGLGEPGADRDTFARVDAAARRLLAAEQIDLRGQEVDGARFPRHIKPWPWAKAEERFLWTFERLTALCGSALPPAHFIPSGIFK